jgi:hypothetical protein
MANLAGFERHLIAIASSEMGGVVGMACAAACARSALKSHSAGSGL